MNPYEESEFELREPTCFICGAFLDSEDWELFSDRCTLCVEAEEQDN